MPVAPDVLDSPLYNADLAPTPEADRKWNLWHLAALWIGMSVCIPTYMLAASLLSQGMSWVGEVAGRCPLSRAPACIRKPLFISLIVPSPQKRTLRLSIHADK